MPGQTNLPCEQFRQKQELQLRCSATLADARFRHNRTSRKSLLFFVTAQQAIVTARSYLYDLKQVGSGHDWV